MIFAILLIIVILIECFITFSFLKLWQVDLNAAFTLICLMSLTIAVQKNPGYLKNDNKDFL